MVSGLGLEVNPNSKHQYGSSFDLEQSIVLFLLHHLMLNLHFGMFVIACGVSA